MTEPTFIGQFAAASRYPGRRVLYADGVFTIEGTGPVPAIALVAWAEHGQLQWVDPQVAQWVGDRTRTGATAPVVDDMRPKRRHWVSLGQHKIVTLVVAVALVMGLVAVAVAGRVQSGRGAHSLDPRCYAALSPAALQASETNSKTIVALLIYAADNHEAPLAWGCHEHAWADLSRVDDKYRSQFIDEWVGATVTTPAEELGARSGKLVDFRAIAFKPGPNWMKSLGNFEVQIVRSGGEWHLGILMPMLGIAPDMTTTQPHSTTTSPPSTAAVPTVPPTSPPTSPPATQQAEIVAKTLSLNGFVTVSFQVESGGSVIAGGDETFTVDEDLSSGVLVQTADRAAYVNALVAQLEADGWQQVGRGSAWYSYQFKK